MGRDAPERGQHPSRRPFRALSGSRRRAPRCGRRCGRIQSALASGVAPVGRRRPLRASLEVGWICPSRSSAGDPPDLLLIFELVDVLVH
eukprot:6113586-Alexandrium_andersonii.AAC.1